MALPPTYSFSIENLIKLGLKYSDAIHYQSTPEELILDTLKRGEGVLTDSGALAIKTGEFTGRAPQDKFTVKDEIIADTINWNNFNLPIEAKYFDVVHRRVMEYLNDQSEIWVRDCYACADKRYRMNIRVLTEKPSTNLFAYNMFLRPTEEELNDFTPAWHIMSAPGLKLNPQECGTRQQNAVIVSFKHRMILIAGSGYTGEMKKGIFGVLNYILPRERDVLSMHCSANVGKKGDTAIFFGLSGTGKTTLSADPNRRLIGDDEHGWTEDNVFNFEGGCYAKLINLTKENEPEIFNALKHGCVVENVSFFPGTNEINFGNDNITENTRASYPLPFINNSVEEAMGDIPRNIFFLTCDAYGVLPPIAKLDKGQAMYQFISGYTAKIAGTEEGVTEPKPTFSACFGAPFLPLHPSKYAEMLGRKMEKHKVDIWLINTGWTGGSYGVGKRIKLAHTRAIIAAVLDGKLKDAEYNSDPIFGIAVPTEVPGVPTELLYARNTWADRNAYDEKALFLAGLFRENFKKFASVVSKEIQDSEPII